MQELLGAEQGGSSSLSTERFASWYAAALALRALAHPLRWKLIDLLGSEGSAQPTRCAEVLGGERGYCAYHLGIPAKYGYIELVPGQAGREKPWRLASYRQELSAKGSRRRGGSPSRRRPSRSWTMSSLGPGGGCEPAASEPAEWRESLSAAWLDDVDDGRGVRPAQR